MLPRYSPKGDGAIERFARGGMGPSVTVGAIRLVTTRPCAWSWGRGSRRSGECRSTRRVMRSGRSAWRCARSGSNWASRRSGRRSVSRRPSAVSTPGARPSTGIRRWILSRTRAVRLVTLHKAVSLVQRAQTSNSVARPRRPLSPLPPVASQKSQRRITQTLSDLRRPSAVQLASLSARSPSNTSRISGVGDRQKVRNESRRV